STPGLLCARRTVRRGPYRPLRPLGSREGWPDARAEPHVPVPAPSPVQDLHQGPLRVHERGSDPDPDRPAYPHHRADRATGTSPLVEADVHESRRFGSHRPARTAGTVTLCPAAHIGATAIGTAAAPPGDPTGRRAPAVLTLSPERGR